MAGKDRVLERGSERNDLKEKQFVIDIEDEDVDENSVVYAKETEESTSSVNPKNMNDEQDVEGDGERVALLPVTQNQSHDIMVTNANNCMYHNPLRV